MKPHRKEKLKHKLSKEKKRHLRLIKGGKEKSGGKPTTMLEKIQDRLRKLEQGRGELWKAEKGKNRIRVMPSWRGKNEEFYRLVPQHWGVGPNARMVRCGIIDGKGKCRVCKRVTKLAQSDSAKKQKRAEDMQAKVNAMLNIYDYGQPDRGVQVWSCSTFQLKELLGHYTDADYGDFTDPKTGFDVIVTKTGQKKGTRYAVRLSRNPTRFKKWKKLKNQLVDIDKRFKPTPPDRVLAILEGRDESYGGGAA
jgi:hypothetical protein